MDTEVRCEDCGFSFRMDAARVREQAALSCPQCRGHQLAITRRQAAPPPAPEVSAPGRTPPAPKPEDTPEELPQIGWGEPSTEPPAPPATHEVIFDKPPEAQTHEVISDAPPPPEGDDAVEGKRFSPLSAALRFAGPDLLTWLTLLGMLSLCLVATVIHPLVGAIGLIPAAVGAQMLRRRIYNPLYATLLPSPPWETAAPHVPERSCSGLCILTAVACTLLIMLIIGLTVQ